MKGSSSALFIAEMLYNFIKSNLSKYMSTQRSEILQFYGLLLSKPYKVSAKKAQKSCLSWYWRVMQSLKKSWLAVSNVTWGIWILTQPLKSLKNSLRWALFLKVYKAWAKKYRGDILMTPKSDTKLNKLRPCSFKNGMYKWVNVH